MTLKFFSNFKYVDAAFSTNNFGDEKIKVSPRKKYKNLF